LLTAVNQPQTDRQTDTQTNKQWKK